MKIRRIEIIFATEIWISSKLNRVSLWFYKQVPFGTCNAKGEMCINSSTVLFLKYPLFILKTRCLSSSTALFLKYGFLFNC